MEIPAIAKKALMTAQQSSIVAPLFNLFMGRCTFFAIVFTVCGLIGFFRGKDLTSYSLFVGSIQALLVLHSWKSDIADQRAAQQQMQTTTVVVDTPPSNPQS